VGEEIRLILVVGGGVVGGLVGWGGGWWGGGGGWGGGGNLIWVNPWSNGANKMSLDGKRHRREAPANGKIRWERHELVSTVKVL